MTILRTGGGSEWVTLWTTLLGFGSGDGEGDGEGDGLGDGEGLGEGWPPPELELGEVDEWPEDVLWGEELELREPLVEPL